MRFVIVESPYAGNIQVNVAYARAAVRDCLNRGEAPFASHLLYTQPAVLRDEDPLERTKGIGAGLELAKRADATVVYRDLGLSRGMELGIAAAERAGRPVEYRWLRAVDGRLDIRITEEHDVGELQRQLRQQQQLAQERGSRLSRAELALAQIAETLRSPNPAIVDTLWAFGVPHTLYEVALLALPKDHPEVLRAERVGR